MGSEDLKGRFFTRQELEKEGWEVVEQQGEAIVVFKKGKKHIVWNSVNHLIENEYEYEVV